jgi:uncharacterized protein
MKILVVAKSPQSGQVKTRLCPPLDADQAAEVAAAALADTLDAVAGSGADERWLALAGPVGDWLPEGFVVVDQRGSTFPERLVHAWDSAGAPTLQIGMDTPQLTAADLDDSCSALLGSTGAVLGPATDGGWWALGMMRSDRRVFDGVVMNRATTGRDQKQRLASLGLEPTLLPTMRDVDFWSDALIVTADSPSGRFGRTVSRLAAELPGVHDTTPTATARDRVSP